MMDNTALGSRSDYASRSIDVLEKRTEGVFIYPKEQRSGNDPAFLKQIQDDIGTLDHMHSVSKMEPKFTDLMDDVIHTAITLSNHCQEVTHIDKKLNETETGNIEKCWGYLTELSKAIQWHIHKGYDYHKFHYSVSNVQSQIDELKKKLSSRSALSKDDLSIISQVNDLMIKSKTVSPLHLRRQMKSTENYKAYLLTTLCLEDGTWIERGNVLDVACVNSPNNLLKNEWHANIRTSAGRMKAIRLPATCFWLLESEPNPTPEELEAFSRRDRDSLCECTENSFNKLTVLALTNELRALVDDQIRITNANIKEGLKNVDATEDVISIGHEYDRIIADNPKFSFYPPGEKSRRISDSDSLKREVDLLNGLLKERRNLNSTTDDMQSHDSEMDYKQNLSKELNTFFASLDSPEQNNESLTCISNIQRPIERNILYSTLSKKSREASIREKSTPLIDSNAYNLSDELADEHFIGTGRCPCKYCGCGQSTPNEVYHIKDATIDSKYRENEMPSHSISRELPVYSPERYGTMPKYFAAKPVETITDQTITSLAREPKIEPIASKKKKNKKFYKKNPQDESGVEFTPESEFEDYHIKSIPRQRRQMEDALNPQNDYDNATDTIGSSTRDRPSRYNLYEKGSVSKRPSNKPLFIYEDSNPDQDWNNDTLDTKYGRDRSLDSITDTVVKSKIRPNRSKSTDAFYETNDPITKDSTMKSYSRDRLSIIPIIDKPQAKGHHINPNNVSSIDDSVYPLTPEWTDEPRRNVRDNNSYYEREEDNNMPFFEGADTSYLSKPKKSHRIQVGFPRLESNAMREVSVQIGPTSQESYSEYRYPESLDLVSGNDTLNTLRGKRIQNGFPSVGKESYSTAFQIGPRMVDSGVDAQNDLEDKRSRRVESFGKKLQVGEPYWTGVSEVPAESYCERPSEEVPIQTDPMTEQGPFNAPVTFHARQSRPVDDEYLIREPGNSIARANLFTHDNTKAGRERHRPGENEKSLLYSRYNRESKYKHAHSSTHSLCIHLHFDDCFCCGQPHDEEFHETHTEILDQHHDRSCRIKVYNNCNCDCRCGCASRESVIKNRITFRRSRSLDETSPRNQDQF